MLLVFVSLVCLLGGLGVAGMAEEQGRHFGRWFAFGWLNPIIALIAIEMATPVAPRGSR